MTNHTIPLAGVVGWPIAHSRSPALHGHWLQRYGIKGQYVALGVKAQNFESSIRSLPNLGFKGVNITIPYKETVLSIATSVTDRASLIGAANATASFKTCAKPCPIGSPTSGPLLFLGLAVLRAP